MTQDASALTLPEELLLLTLDPERGKPLCDRTHLRYGTAGAVLAELELRAGYVRSAAGSRWSTPWTRPTRCSPRC